MLLVIFCYCVYYLHKQVSPFQVSASSKSSVFHPHNMHEEKRKKSMDIKTLFITALVLAVFGTICVLVTTFAPWRKTYVQSCQLPYVTYDGIWYYCMSYVDWHHGLKCVPNLNVKRITPSFLQKGYSPAFLQASRVLVCVSLACVLSAWAPLILGLRRFLQHREMRIPLITAGSMLLTAAVVFLIPVTVSTVNLEQLFPQKIIRHFDTIGLGLYLGWAGSGFLVVAGVIVLCCNMSSVTSGRERSTEEASPCMTYNALQKTDTTQLSQVWIV